jgi:Cd2+/Zn2+-exporting ATPase
LEKLKIEVDLVVPSDVAACDRCVERISASLKGCKGLEKIHIDAAAGSAKPTLCFHFDPEVIGLEHVRRLVSSSGASLGARFAHLSVEVEGLRHERQAKIAEAAIASLAGVLSAKVAFGSKRLLVELDATVTTRKAVLAALPKAGLTLKGDASDLVAKAPPAVEKPHAEGDGHDHGYDHAENDDDHSAEGEGGGDHEGHAHGPRGHKHGGPFGEASELVFSLGAGLFTGFGWGLSKLDVSSTVSTALYVAAYVMGCWFTVQEVAVALRAKKFEIDFLMLVAAAGAAALGNWLEGALLLFLFTLGHALEGYAMGRARKAIAALSKLAPPTALRVDSAGNEAEVPVAKLVVGDRVLVKPNSRVPADGFVVAGSSSVDQAPITGESVPVEKRPVPDAETAAKDPNALPPEHRAFAGTINGASALTVVVTRLAPDSTLARVVKMVAEAETQKSATQRFTDRFERIFVPTIVIGVVLLAFAWVVVDEPFAKSFYRAMAVLVAASPCALAIATPSAVLAGVARAARAGVLVKGGAHLESLGTVDVVAFDKTGTLTEGRPKLTEVVPAAGIEERELLRIALAVEKSSDHPLASAIVEGATARLSAEDQATKAEGVEAIIGFGVRATVDGAVVEIGKPGLFTKDAPLPGAIASTVEALQGKGRTLMVVRAGQRFLGVVGVMDTPRENASRVVAELHSLGVSKTLMLSGDNQRVAEAVAATVGIRSVRGDLLPEDKVKVVAELAKTTKGVAMVGDGVNDAPAMAHATVGIAMGAGGSDVALETADVALMADDLSALPFAVGLSRSARAIIRQNLFMSLGMVAFLIPATLFGFAKIGVAVALHEGSTVIVVINALRLLAYRDTRGKASARER